MAEVEQVFKRYGAAGSVSAIFIGRGNSSMRMSDGSISTIEVKHFTNSELFLPDNTALVRLYDNGKEVCYQLTPTDPDLFKGRKLAGIVDILGINTHQLALFAKQLGQKIAPYWANPVSGKVLIKAMSPLEQLTNCEIGKA